MDTLKFCVIGCGNIGSSIAEGIGSVVLPKNITLTRRNMEALKPFRDKGYNISNNKEALHNSDIIIIAVSPKQMDGVIQEIREEIQSKHTIISVVTGASINDIRNKVDRDISYGVVRAMPNTAISLRQSMTCIACNEPESKSIQIAKDIFNSLGKCMLIREDQMTAATALCACGVAFFCRAIRAASQGGVEIGFHAEEAIMMAAQTAKGAAALILEGHHHPESEVDKVTTPQGCTIVGLNKMEHSGFSSSFIKGIVTSAEKAAILYQKKPE